MHHETGDTDQMLSPTGHALSIEGLRELARSGAVDTVIAAITDMQGRLQGKRFHARYFLDEIAAHGTEACNYLLAVDVDMQTVAGYEISSWERGYGDTRMVPDWSTLRRVPWETAAVMVQCDLFWPDDSPLLQSPREVLRGQLRRLEEHGLKAYAGTELEFMVFDDTYEQAWSSRYGGLTPSNQYNVDYSILGTSRVEPLLRDIRNSMQTAGAVVESAKGECNLGQHEIGFLYDEAMRTCDNHAVYKTAAKQIAHSHGKALTFMSKFDHREGNSCHIHLSLRDSDGRPAFADGEGESALFASFTAGVLRTMRELTLLYAPNVNSYKRFAAGSFAPTTIAWGRDNRTCAIRVVGRGQSLRLENRVPGGDVNPYLAVAAIIAGGLAGVEQGLPLESALVGNAYDSAQQRLPRTLSEARDLFAESAVAQQAFGAEVVAHYVNAADVELAAFEASVTDWERIRGFERL